MTFTREERVGLRKVLDRMECDAHNIISSLGGSYEDAAAIIAYAGLPGGITDAIAPRDEKALFSRARSILDGKPEGEA